MPKGEVTAAQEAFDLLREIGDKFPQDHECFSDYERCATIEVSWQGARKINALLNRISDTKGDGHGEL